MFEGSTGHEGMVTCIAGSEDGDLIITGLYLFFYYSSMNENTFSEIILREIGKSEMGERGREIEWEQERKELMR